MASDPFDHARRRYPPVTATYHADDEMWAVAFRYHAALVDMVKASCPPWCDRWWDAETRCWWIDPHGYGYVAEAFRREGVVITENGDEVTPTAEETAWADALFAAVGPERIEAVFRALTRVLHPDAPTGNHDLMQQLNRARDKATVSR